MRFVMKKLWTGLLACLCVALGLSSYEYVIADHAAAQEDAEKAACSVKKCDDRHGMTKLDQSPLGQTFEFTWRNGTVTVHCVRRLWLMGERSCVVER